MDGRGTGPTGLDRPGAPPRGHRASSPWPARSRRPTVGRSRPRTVLRAGRPARRAPRPARRRWWSSATAVRPRPRREGWTRSSSSSPAAGLAVAAVNYRGSSGYGRDLPQAARRALGRGRRRRLRAVRLGPGGGGAGRREPDGHPGHQRRGLTALGALIRSDRFAGAAAWYGVTDLEALAADTHDFESHYVDSLVGPWPEAAETYRARSPIHGAGRVTRAGAPDPGGGRSGGAARPVRAVRRPLAERGVPCRLMLFEGESHGFRRAVDHRGQPRGRAGVLPFAVRRPRRDRAPPIPRLSGRRRTGRSAPGRPAPADSPGVPGGTLDRADRPPADAPGRPVGRRLGCRLGGLSGVGPAVARVAPGALSPEGRDAFLYGCSALFAGVTAFAVGHPPLPPVGPDGRGPLCRGGVDHGRRWPVVAAADRPGASGPGRSAGPPSTRPGVPPGDPGTAAPGPRPGLPRRRPIDRRAAAGGRPGWPPSSSSCSGPPSSRWPGGGLALRGQCRPPRPARGPGGGAGRRPGRPRQGPLPGGGPERPHPHPPAHRADLRALLPVPAGDGGLRLLHRQQGRGPPDRRPHPVPGLHRPGRPVRPQPAAAAHRRPGAGPPGPDRPAHRGAARWPPAGTTCRWWP